MEVCTTPDPHRSTTTIYGCIFQIFERRMVMMTGLLIRIWL